MPNETVRLLDRWKKKMGIASDYEAAHRLGVSRMAVSAWRNRPSQANAAVIVQMCEDLGEDLGPCLMRIARDPKGLASAAARRKAPGRRPGRASCKATFPRALA